MYALLLILLNSVFLSSSSAQLRGRQACSGDYQICSPEGATIAALPPVGLELSSLYTDLIQSINTEGSGDAIGGRSTQPVKKQDHSSLCCAQTSTCLLLVTFKVPFCWDQFTTDYYFPDGSYGSIVAGNFTSSSGIQVNLIYGDYRDANGTIENIYSATPTMMPATSTMSMPTPWTSSGVGSAIPGSMLGSNATITETISEVPSTTITAITLPSTTISVGTSVCHACNFTIIPGPTGSPAMVPTTIPDTTATTSFSNVTAPIGTGSAMGTSTMHPNITVIPPLTVNHAKSTTAVGLEAVILFGVTMSVLLFAN